LAGCGFSQNLSSCVVQRHLDYRKSQKPREAGSSLCYDKLLHSKNHFFKSPLSPTLLRWVPSLVGMPWDDNIHRKQEQAHYTIITSPINTAVVSFTIEVGTILLFAVGRQRVGCQNGVLAPRRCQEKKLLFHYFKKRRMFL
jgi:hypothetical protein